MPDTLTAAVRTGLGHLAGIAAVVALQPGTVRSKLTRPFVAGEQATDPDIAVEMLLEAMDGLVPDRRALFIDYKGDPIPW